MVGFDILLVFVLHLHQIILVKVFQILQVESLFPYWFTLQSIHDISYAQQNKLPRMLYFNLFKNIWSKLFQICYE